LLFHFASIYLPVACSCIQQLLHVKLRLLRKVCSMIKPAALVSALISILVINALGQQGPPPPSPQPSPRAVPAQDPLADDDVVRITTNLVQVDAVVTDRDGNQVTDLRPEDFEILENGRVKQISNFSYITIGPTAIPATTAAAPASAKPRRDPNVPPVPPARLRPTQVQRTIALVVDDLTMSAESVYFTRKALKKYVDEQVQPGDLVAIIRASAGIGTLQQFTNDRQRLYAAIERVRWIPTGGGLQGAFAPINPLDRLAGDTTRQQSSLPDSADSQRVGVKELNDYRVERFTVGTLGALNFVVSGLRELPGRKAVVLFSDGFSIQDSHGGSTQILTSLQRLIDLANRASVVFYTIDSRGPQPNGLTAADNTNGSIGSPLPYMRPDQIGMQVLHVRSAQMDRGQDGLRALAKGTGGVALINNNDLNHGIRRALNDMSGYYLIGYRPDEGTFDPTTGHVRFNRLIVRLKSRPKLLVRSRSGFIGVAEKEARPQPHTRAEQLMTALVSPFGAGDVNLRLTSLFMSEPATGPVMRSMLLIDPRNLTFTQQPDGQYQAVMDILAVTVGEKWEVIDQLNRVETIRVRPEALQRFLSDGMVYDLNVPIHRPGGYQLRVAVRDTATGRVGSASQYVSVPNLSQKRLTLSGLVVASASIVSSARKPDAVASGGGTAEAEDPEVGPAARNFRRGMQLDYGFIIYNARLDSGTLRPQLTTQARLFRDGKEVFAGLVQPFDPSQQADLERLKVGGRLQLGSQLAPGEYVLQVVVTDALADKQHRMATQWIDFEILN
jgi:VWFA-related protein